VQSAVYGPVSENSVLELGSITKVVTGLLLATAVVRGDVTLDTQLPQCLSGARSRRPISLGDLASHTAGLPRPPIALFGRRSSWSLTDPYAATTIEELVKHLKPARVSRKPGMRYSNFGALPARGRRTSGVRA
jgi:CubicO group peptidase (beta-lactamase class C family)